MQPTKVGKVCAKHPELGGERYISNCACPSCAREAALRYSRSEKGKDRKRAYLATDSGTASQRRGKAKYRTSDHGKQTARAYAQRPDVKEKARAYQHTERPRAYQAVMRQTEKRRDYQRAYRKRPEITAAKRIYKATRDNHVSTHATPPWNDAFAMASIYAEAKRLTAEAGERYVVDHIVPLKHPLVCGLHAHTNLRVVPEIVNLRKNNRFNVGEQEGA